MKILRQVLLALLVAIGVRVLVDVPMGASNWLEIIWELALLLAIPVVTWRMPRRKRGTYIFLWLFMAGVLVLGEIMLGIAAPSVSLVIYGVVLCSLGWYVKVREMTPERITA